MKNVAPTKRRKALQESADAQYEIYKRSHEQKLWVERRNICRSSQNRNCEIDHKRPARRLLVSALQTLRLT